MKKILFITAMLIGFLGSAQDSIVKAVSLKGRGPFLVKGSINGTTITGAQIVDSLNLELGSTDWQSGGSDDQTASEVPITDAGNNYSSGNVEGALAEVADSLAVKVNVDPNSPRKGLIWGPGTKAEFYADYPYPSTGFPENGIAFLTDSIVPKPPVALDSLTDVVKGSPAANSDGTLRVLADPNEDGTYTEVDWTPPIVVPTVPNPANSTVIDLSSYLGSRYVASANAATAYTLTGITTGGWAKVLINSTTEPTITGATKIVGSDFVPSTNMYMIAYSDNGTTVEYYFMEI